MRILTLLNVSNISSIEADSGYVFMQAISRDLIRLGHEIIMVGPPNMPNHNGINIIEIELPQSKYGVRLGFAWQELQIKLADKISDIDILLINQSELTLAFAMLVYEILGRKIPCVTYFHYLAVQSLIDQKTIFDPSLNDYSIAPYLWQRQIEAAHFSDYNIIGSAFGKSLFLRAMPDCCTLRNKFSIIPPPTNEMLTHSKGDQKSSITILYNHRLYEHYGTRRIFNYLNELFEKIQFTVLVTDPTHNRSLIREKLDKSTSTIKQWLHTFPFVKIKHFKTQADYLDAILESDIALAPMRTGALWSMAIADAMSMAIPVVAPNEGAYPEMICDKELIYQNKDEFNQIIEKLIYDCHYRKIKGEHAKKNITQKTSPLVVGKKIESILLSLLTT